MIHDINTRIGLVYINTGKYDDAMDCFNKAIDYYKSLPSVHTRHMRMVISKFEGYIKDNQVDKETKLHNQRRLKNYTVLMDKTLNRDYHDYLDPRICKFLDTIDCDVK